MKLHHLFIVGFLAFSAVSANADGKIPSTKLISVQFAGDKPATVLRNVADIYGLNLVLPEDFPKEGAVHLALKHVDWRDIFELTLVGTGYTYICSPTGTVHVVPAASEEKAVILLREKLDAEMAENSEWRAALGRMLQSDAVQISEEKKSALLKVIKNVNQSPQDFEAALALGLTRR